MREKNIVLLLEVLFVMVVCLVITSVRDSSDQQDFAKNQIEETRSIEDVASLGFFDPR